MGKQYTGKLVLVSERTTKSQLAEHVARLLTEVADIMVERNALKKELVEYKQDNQHLSMQLAVAKENVELLKHRNRNLTNDHWADATRYIAGPEFFKPKPIEPIAKTFLQRIFDRFQI